MRRPRTGKFNQQGLGLISGLVTLSIAGLLFIFALRLFPIYYNYFSVRDIMRDVARENRGANVSPTRLWRSIEKRLNVNGIDYINASNFKVIRGKNVNWLNLKYEARTPYLWNIDLVARFDIREKS